MQQSILTKIKLFILRNRQNRIFRKFVQVLCCMVVFVTTYALILPAITMEQDAFCGKEAHEHTEECLQPVPVPVLVCTQESLGIHTHSGSCYNADGAVICGQADYVVHSHSGSCYDAAGQLVCLLPERSSHVHGESCYIPGETQPEILHVHSEACYIQEQGELICTEEEREGHSHGDQCYGPGDLLECTLTEHHVHDASCYSLPLTCSISTEPHVHSENCYGTGNLQCSTPEYHTHTDSCWDRTLSCNETDETHCHDDGCYTANLRCQIPENHAHSSSCYESILVCGKEAGQAHEHNDSCYGTEPQLQCRMPENHVHDTGCYNRVLNCEVPEDPGHRHEDACYQWNSVLNCGLEEGQPEPTEPPEPVLACTEPEAPVHVHGDSCFELQEKTCQGGEDHQHTDSCYTCGLEAHAHTLICYSDPDADVESPEVWKATFAHVTLTGDWPTDVVAIAETQLGYTESTRNYDVWEDNSIHGYTRYGAWYGAPHGDWCGMFASFCLNYAEVKGMPHNYGVRPWIEDLTKLGLYYTAKETKAQKGNLIFFDWDADGLSDHVGIVAEVQEPQEHTGASVKTIEGNSGNAVRYQHYDPNDPVILGYGLLPGQERIPLEGDPEVLEELDRALSILICGTPAHTHGEACYDAEGTLVCEKQEHTHTIDCADPSSPVGYADGGVKLRSRLMTYSDEPSSKVKYYNDIAQMLTHIEIYDSNNTLVYESKYASGTKELTIGETCKIKLYFNESDSMQFKEGNNDILYYNIPDNLSAGAVGSGVVRNRNGTIVASYEISDNLLQITPILVENKNFFADFNNVFLEVSFFAEMRSSDDSTSEIIKFNGNYSIEINQKHDTKIDAFKEEVEYNYQTQTISYKSTVTAYGGTLKVNIISDWCWPENAGLVEDSLRLTDQNGNVYTWEQLKENWDLTVKHGYFSLEPKNEIILKHQESITLTYDLKVDNNISENFDLTNTFYADGYDNTNTLIKDQEDVITPVYVTNVHKDGVQEKEPVGDEIQDVLKWTVTIDNPYMDDITIEDQLGPGQTLCPHQPIIVKSMKPDGTYVTSEHYVTQGNNDTSFKMELPKLVYQDGKNEYKEYVVTYYSHFEFTDENTKYQTFSNTVKTNVKIANKPTTATGTVGAIGVPYGINKTAQSDDYDWITFTIDCRMAGALYNQNNVILYDSLGSWGNENLYVQLVPDSLQVTVTPDNGTSYQLQPYTDQESAENTYLLVNNGPEFTMYFNTDEPTASTSVWKCAEDSTLTISYRVSRDSPMLDLSADHNPTGETFEHFLNRTNQSINNYAKLDYAPGYSIDTSVNHKPPVRVVSPIIKTAEVSKDVNGVEQDGVYEYCVTFRPNNSEYNIFNTLTEDKYPNDVTSLTFIDSYDKRLTYVEDSFVVYAWADWNKTTPYAEYKFIQGKGPSFVSSGDTTTISVKASDLIGYKGDPWVCNQDLVYSMQVLQNQYYFEFRYKLLLDEQVKKDAKEAVLELDNEASIKWTDTISSDNEVGPAYNEVTYETGILRKEMKREDNTNVVQFTIWINPNETNLAKQGDSYELYDKMSDNLVLVKNTVMVEKMDVATKTPEGTIGLDDCQFEYDSIDNIMTFTLPDEQWIRITYNCHVKGDTGDKVDISNIVELMGQSTVVENASFEFEVVSSDIYTDGNGGEFTIKKFDSNTKKPLQGAVFKLYGDTKPNEGAQIELTVIHHDHSHDLYYHPNDENNGVYETDANGEVLVSDKHLAPNHLYALVEVKAPDGYAALSEPILFYMEQRESGATNDTRVAYYDTDFPIPNDPIGYELPATGGAGKELYTVGGMLLMMAALILLYNQRKCRKEDIYSS